MLALLTDILRKHNVAYSMDSHTTPSNIYIQCESDTCRDSGPRRKLHLGILVAPTKRASAGAFHCWSCGFKGRDVLASIDKVLPQSDPLQPPSQLYAEEIAAYLSGRNVQRKRVDDLLDWIFETPPGVIDEEVLNHELFSGVKDKNALRTAIELYGVVYHDNGLYMREYDKTGSFMSHVHGNKARLIHAPPPIPFASAAERFGASRRRVVSGAAEALLLNVDNVRTNDTAISCEWNADVAGVEMGLPHPYDAVSEGLVRFASFETYQRAKAHLLNIYPDYYFETEEDALREMLLSVSLGVIAVDDLKTVDDILDGIVVKSSPVLRPSLCIVGASSDLETFNGSGVVMAMNLHEAFNTTEVSCAESYKHVVRVRDSVKIVTAVTKQSVDSFLQTLPDEDSMIIAVGSGAFELINACADTSLEIDTTSKERKHLMRQVGWMRTVRIAGHARRLLCVATSQVASPYRSAAGKDNKLTIATNAVFTRMYRKHIWEYVGFFVKNVRRLWAVLPTDAMHPDRMLDDIECHFELTPSAMEEMSNFAHDNVLGVDIETTGLTPYRKEARFKVLSWAISDGVRTHSVWLTDSSLTEAHILDVFTKCKRAVLHNAGFDLKILMWCYPSVREYIIRHPEKFEDTAGLAHKFRIFGKTDRYAEYRMTSLNLLTLLLFGVAIKQSAAAVDRSRMFEYLRKGAADKKTLLLYNGGDSKWTVLAYKRLHHAAGTSDGVESAEYRYYKHTMRVLIACCEIANNGMPLDLDAVIDLGNELQDECDELYAQIQNFPLVQQFLQQSNGKYTVLNPRSGPARKAFAVDFIGLPDPEPREVKAHKNSKAQVWKTYTDVNGRCENPDAFSVFDTLIRYSQCAGLLGGSILSLRNVLLVALRDKPEKLETARFLTDGGAIDAEKYAEYTNTEDTEWIVEEEDAYEDDAYDFGTSSKTDHFLNTSVDEDGVIRLHTTFYVDGTKSGRIASRSPNVQNVTPRARRMFAAPPGKILIACDLGGADITGAALEFFDTTLIENLWEGIDTHGVIATKLFKITKDTEDDFYRRMQREHPEYSEKEIFKEVRRLNKSLVVFAFLYGSVKMQIQESLGIRNSTFEPFFEFVVEYLGGIDEGHRNLINEFKAKGYYTWKITGTRIYGDNTITEMFNLPIQGATALTTNSAALQLIQSGAHLCNHIHDELLLEESITVTRNGVECDNVTPMVHLVSKTMVTEVFKWWGNRIQGIVPLQAEVSIGKKWSELKSNNVWEDSSTNHGHQRTVLAKPKYYNG